MSARDAREVTDYHEERQEIVSDSKQIAKKRPTDAAVFSKGHRMAPRCAVSNTREGGLRMSIEGFIDRILELLVNPAEEWGKIKEEGADDLWRYLLSHLTPIIFLNVVSYFVGVVFVGSKTLGTPIVQHLSAARAFFATVLLAAAYVGIIFIGAIIVKLIATSFDSEQDENNAFKLVAFSLYPLLVFGSLHIIPTLKAGTMAGFYGLYLLYTGFPVLLKTPKEKSAGFTLVISLTIIGMLALAFSLINIVSGAELNLRAGV